MNLEITLATALLGGFIFEVAHLPLSWLLGPMLAAFVGSGHVRQHFTWPIQIRNTGMIVVGYTVGLSMRGAALRQMSQQLPSMVMMTAILILFCAGISAVVSHLSGDNYKTKELDTR